MTGITPLGQPPAGMCATARAEWRRVVKLLASMKVGAAIDAASLAAYCRTWAEWKKLLKVTQRKDFDYLLEPHRKVARMLAATEERLSKLAQQFGFTPASRARVKVESTASGDGEDAAAAAAREAAEKEKKFFGGPRVHQPEAG